MTEPKGPPEPGIITSAQACTLLMLSRQRIDQLVHDGFIQRHAPGQFRLVDLVQNYIRFMRDEGRRTSKSAADSRVRDARAHEIELRTAERSRHLVEFEDFAGIFTELIGMLRAALSGLPARVTRDLAFRRTIETAVNDILDRIADAALARSRNMGPDLAGRAALATDDAGRMGGTEPGLSPDGGDTGTA